MSESKEWTDAWEECESYFDRIKEGLKRIKEIRETEFTALEHRTVINKILDIFEVL